MSDIVTSWLIRRKWILVGVGVPVLVAAWWAFRPEKLWVNVKVNEPAPTGHNRRSSTSLHRANGRLERILRAGALQSTKRLTASATSAYGFHHLEWSGRSCSSCSKHRRKPQAGLC